jgi:hypothetical protein
LEEIWSTFKKAARVSALAGFAAAAAAFMLTDIPSAAALLLSDCAGITSLYFLIKDAGRIMLEESPKKFYIIRFSLRFAAFALFLYLMLGLWRVNFIPVLAGLMLPIFSFTALVFSNQLRRRRF